MEVVKLNGIKIGDRVRCIQEYDDNSSIVGELGTITIIFEGIVTVEFDSDIDGHSGHGRYSITKTKKLHENLSRNCWNCSEQQFGKRFEMVNKFSVDLI